MDPIAPEAGYERMHSTNVLVLTSGGIDSAACISIYLSQGAVVEALFFDYGQRSKVNEEAAAQNITAHFQIRLRVVRCQLGAFGSGLIQGRNGFLLNAALVAMGKSHGVIAIGVHAGTSYVDCSPRFIQ